MPFTVWLCHHTMRHCNACRIVANSPLMPAVGRQYCPWWKRSGRVRAMLAAGSWEPRRGQRAGPGEMEEMAGRIRNAAAII